jgi:hypothetical protein
MQASGSVIVGTGYGLHGAARLARAHPVAAGIVAAAAGVYAYCHRAGSPPTPARSSPGSARKP